MCLIASRSLRISFNFAFFVFGAVEGVGEVIVVVRGAVIVDDVAGT